ncbi:MAG: hypothetical protein K0S38_311 [Candidatus Paceibacter sp.]|jgi:hypothetical protein|nr:hypothetical protein [Candidatus Paceibacter sp.]
MNWDTTKSYTSVGTILMLLAVGATIALANRKQYKIFKTMIYSVLIVGCIGYFYYLCVLLVLSRGVILEEVDLLQYRYSPGTEVEILKNTDDTGRGTYYHIVHVAVEKNPTCYEFTSRYEPGTYVLVSTNDGLKRTLRKIVK